MSPRSATNGGPPVPTDATTPVPATGYLYATPIASSSRLTRALVWCSWNASSGRSWMAPLTPAIHAANSSRRGRRSTWSPVAPAPRSTAPSHAATRTSRARERWPSSHGAGAAAMVRCDPAQASACGAGGMWWFLYARAGGRELYGLVESLLSPQPLAKDGRPGLPAGARCQRAWAPSAIVEHGRRRRVSWGGCGLTREPRHGRLVPAGRARDKAFSIYSPLPIRATTLICCDFGQKQTLVFFILGNPIVTGTRVERVQSEFGTTRGIICSISVHSFFCMHDKKKIQHDLRLSNTMGFALAGRSHVDNS
jgi:hypothetical protein